MAGDCCNVELTPACCGGVNKQNEQVPGVEADPNEIGSMAWRLGIAFVLAGQSMVFGLGINITPPDWGSFAYIALHSGLFLVAMIVMFLLGLPLLKATWGCFREKKLSLEGLFTLSMVGALGGSVISSVTGRGEVYYEVVAIVVVIYSLGKIIGLRSRNKAIQASNQVRDNFDFAYVVVDGVNRKKVKLEELDCCSLVSVGPGDAIPVDGVVVSGEGYVKETAMTGELEPVVHGKGDVVLAGCYSVDGLFTIKPTGLKGDRRLDALLKTVESAKLTPSALQKQADRIMQWFIPAVIAISLGTFLFWFKRVGWTSSLFNSMAVLLVACPCALGLATPIAIWSGLWKLSRLGLVSRSGDFLDKLASARWLVFDKTGTLSKEALEISGFKFLCKESVIKERALKNVIHAIESKVDHPIAHALSKIGEVSDRYEVKKLNVVPGKGIQADVFEIETKKSFTLYIGEKSLMPQVDNPLWSENKGSFKKTIYISIGAEPAGIVCLDEKMRDNVGDIFNSINKLGIKGVILTGDGGYTRDKIEGLDVKRGLTPNEKEGYVKALEENGESVIYVGDGVNDAAAMSIASASIAMSRGAVLTQSTASAILMGSSLQSLPQSIKVSRQLQRRLRGNMLFAATYNIVGMSLAAMGKLHPVMAAVLMLVSSISVSYRAFKSCEIKD